MYWLKWNILFACIFLGLFQFSLKPIVPTEKEGGRNLPRFLLLLLRGEKEEYIGKVLKAKKEERGSKLETFFCVKLDGKSSLVQPRGT